MQIGSFSNSSIRACKPYMCRMVFSWSSNAMIKQVHYLFLLTKGAIHSLLWFTMRCEKVIEINWRMKKNWGPSLFLLLNCTALKVYGRIHCLRRNLHIQAMGYAHDPSSRKCMLFWREREKKKQINKTDELCEGRASIVDVYWRDAWERETRWPFN